MKNILLVLSLAAFAASAAMTSVRPQPWTRGNAHTPIIVTGAGTEAANDLYLYSSVGEHLLGYPVWYGVTNSLVLTNGNGRSAILEYPLVPIYTNDSRNPTAPWKTVGGFGTGPAPTAYYTNLPTARPEFIPLENTWGGSRPFWPLARFYPLRGTDPGLPVPYAAYFTNGTLGPFASGVFVLATWGWTNTDPAQLPGAIDVYAYTNFPNGEFLIHRQVVTAPLSVSSSGNGTFVWQREAIPNWTNAVFRWRYRTAISNSPWSTTYTNRIRP